MIRLLGALDPAEVIPGTFFYLKHPKGGLELHLRGHHKAEREDYVGEEVSVNLPAGSSPRVFISRLKSNTIALPLPRIELVVDPHSISRTSDDSYYVDPGHALLAGEHAHIVLAGDQTDDVFPLIRLSDGLVDLRASPTKWATFSKWSLRHADTPEEVLYEWSSAKRAVEA